VLTEEQLIIRKNGIGGSDAAAAVGLSPWKTALELYLEKTGQTEPPDFSDNQKIEFGNKLEAVIADTYAERTGYKIRRVNRTLHHPEYDWMLCHLDREVLGNGKRALECKATSSYMVRDWGEEGTDEVPEQVLIQCQHNLAVSGKDVMDVPVLVGGYDFRIYSVERDEGLISNLIDREADFWDRVKTVNQPDPDFNHRTTEELFKRMYPGTNGETIELPGEAHNWHIAMNEAKEQVKLYKGVIDGAKAHLLHLMGEAAVGRLPDGNAYTRKEVNRKGFSVEPSKHIDFRFKKGGK
jgi:putative phage-type endonuclease